MEEYYAHTFPDGTKQTVSEHNNNVAEYAAKNLKNIDIEHVGWLGGYMHDIGKLTINVQDYLLHGGRRGSVNHTFAGTCYILNTWHGDRASSIEDLTAELLGMSCGSHHGLFDAIDENHKSGLAHRQFSDNDDIPEAIGTFKKLNPHAETIQKHFQEAVLEISRKHDIIDSIAKTDAEYHFYLNVLVRLIASAIVDADRRDTAEKYIGKCFAEQPDDMTPIWMQRLRYMENKMDLLPTETVIQQARKSISNICKDAAKKGSKLYKFFAPTGAGKTLSSLRYSLAHAAEWNKERIIFVTPLLAILEQNADVLKEYIGDNSMVLEHYGNLIYDDKDTTKEEQDRHAFLIDSWNTPVIITTMKQFLDTLSDGSTSSVRRFHSLCNSVIILDEVQTVPIRDLTMFNLTMNFLASVCDTTVLMCSATQPCFEKTRHALLQKPDDILPYDPELWRFFDRTELVDAGRMQLADIPWFVAGKAEENNSVLIICNKKAQARHIFRNMPGEHIDCFHMSAGMCPQQRRDMLVKVRASLKDKDRRTVCISTQVMEAGVDISFDCVIRLCAGIDSIVQAAGRANREGLSDAKTPVYIVDCIDENLHTLPEIQKYKEITRTILYRYKRHPERYRYDLMSTESIDEYYNLLFDSRTGFPEGYQDYTVKYKGGTYTLFDMMGENQEFCNPAYFKHDEKNVLERYFLRSALKTAGQLFEVYDAQTTEVIVPYKKGREIIKELCSDRAKSDIEYVKALLTEAKQYTVSLYDYDIKAFTKSGDLKKCSSCDAMYLTERCFDDETGYFHPDKEM